MITRDGRRLGPVAIGVYCALDVSARRGHFKVAEVAALLDMLEGEVQAAIDALVECGWLEVPVGEYGGEDNTVLALVSP
jgi:hypothetical protein